MAVEKKISVSDNSPNESTALTELANIIRDNNIPNALLFTGGNNTFLKKVANNFAKAANCLNPLGNSFFQIPCNKCKSCKKIINNMHPDILHISPDNQTIKISVIRNLYQLIISKPNEAKVRVVLIEDAETMNEQAQNAFLKMLEEPPTNTFFILIANNINPLLATIVSRCRNIWFKPVETPDMETSSIEETNKINWTKRREWLLKEMTNLISNNPNSRFKRLRPLLLAEKLSKEPDLLKDSLAIVRTFLRDLAIIRYSSDKIINSDYLKSLTSISKQLSLRNNIAFFKELYKTERRNKSNPSSIRLNLETLFLKISCRKIN